VLGKRRDVGVYEDVGVDAPPHRLLPLEDLVVRFASTGKRSERPMTGQYGQLPKRRHLGQSSSAVLRHGFPDQLRDGPMLACRHLSERLVVAL